MRYVLPVIAVTVLTACATNPSATNSVASPTETSMAIQAFTDICLKTAPSFSGAAKAAAAYGITDIADAGFMRMGFTKDQSLGVQIKGGKECVITTADQRDRTLTKQFLQAVSQHSGSSVPQSVPVRAKIGNEVYIFQHDRKGGEAFVMLKL